MRSLVISLACSAGCDTHHSAGFLASRNFVFLGEYPNCLQHSLEKGLCSRSSFAWGTFGAKRQIYQNSRLLSRALRWRQAGSAASRQWTKDFKVRSTEMEFLLHLRELLDAERWGLRRLGVCLSVVWFVISIANPKLLGCGAAGLRAVKNWNSRSAVAVAWVSDLHLQPSYYSTGSPEEKCAGGEHSEIDSSDVYREMETQVEFGRLGCPSSPLLVDEALGFLQGLVALSRSSSAGSSPASFNEDRSDAASAFQDYPLEPVQAVLLTGDYVYQSKGMSDDVL